MGIETARRELTLIVALGAEHIYLAVGRIVGRGHVDSAIIGVDANAVNGSRGNFGRRVLEEVGIIEGSVISICLLVLIIELINC